MQDGRHDDALEILNECYRVSIDDRGEFSPDAFTIGTSLVTCLAKAGDLGKSIQMGQRLSRLANQKMGRSDRVTLATRIALARSLVASGKLGDAATMLEDVDAVAKLAFGKRDSLLRDTRLALAQIYIRQREWSKAKELLERLDETWKSQMPDSHPIKLAIRECNKQLPAVLPAE
jgi:lipopolysaccharide biosynthesis regulator YciM